MANKTVLDQCLLI